MRNIKRILTKNGISITFGCCLVLFAIVAIILPDEKNSVTENRPLQQKPNFSIGAFMDGEWQSQMEGYLSDQFPLRSSWVKIHANFEHGLGKKKFNDVYIGKEGTLFQESVVPKKAMLQEKQKALNSFAQRYSDMRISMLLIPNKATVLEDQLPSHIVNQNQRKTMQSFQKGLDDHIRYIDTYPTLYKHRNEELYYRSDHHWTNAGAYLAFLEWKQTMLPEEKQLTYQTYTVNSSFHGTLANSSGYFRGKPDHVEVAVSKEDPLYTVKYADSKKARATLFDLEKADSANPYEVFLSGNHPLIDIATTTENTNHLLLLKDSYANCFVSYLLPYYSNITIVDPRYYYEDLNQLIQDRGITDVLFLYNANTFFSDSSLQNVIMEAK